MNKKYMFFDIDGTLTNDNPGGSISKQTLETIEKLKENGHFVCIATGRAQHLALEASKQTHINNMVTDGGNGITLNGELKYIHPLDRDKSLEIIDEALEFGYTVNIAVDNTDKLYSSSKNQTRQDLHRLIIDENFDYHKVKEIYKIFIFITEEEEYRLTKLKTLGYMRYFKESIIVEPDDKYQGIVEMLKLIGGKEEDVVVFGDGHNDYSMFEKAPMSIAMGNAVDELKKIATFITKTNKEEGITYACKYFNWI